MLKGENNQFLFKSGSAQELSRQFVSCEPVSDVKHDLAKPPLLPALRVPWCRVMFHLSHLKKIPKKGQFIYWAFAGWLRGWHRLPSTELLLSKHLAGTGCVPCTLRAVSSSPPAPWDLQEILWTDVLCCYLVTVGCKYTTAWVPGSWVSHSSFFWHRKI